MPRRPPDRLTPAELRRERHRLRQKQAVKTLRRYAEGFEAGDGYDLRKIASWSKSKKDRLRRYMKEINQYQSRPVYVYRPRKKAHLRKALKFGQMRPLRDWKAALIISPSPEKTQIKFDADGDMYLKVNGVTVREFRWDQDDLIKYGVEGYLEEDKGRFYEKVKGAVAYQLIFGEFLQPGFTDWEDVILSVQDLMDQYSDPALGDKHWRNWLFGVKAYYGRVASVKKKAKEYEKNRRSALDEAARRRAIIKARAKRLAREKRKRKEREKQWRKEQRRKSKRPPRKKNPADDWLYTR